MRQKIILFTGVLFFVISTLIYISCNKNEQPISDRPIADEPSIGGKSWKDQKEACAVSSFVQEKYAAAGTDQKILKIYCKGGALSSHIHIYGITKHGNQDVIVKLVEAEFHKHVWKPVYLLF